MTAQKTLVTMLLDRSGSMQSIWDDTIGAINAYTEELATSDADIRMSLVLFDGTYGGEMDLEKVFVAKPVREIEAIDAARYRPRGGTPLIDAAVTTIKAVADSIKGREDEVKVIIAIQTDGRENCSQHHTWSDLKRLISEKEEHGWEFIFMGAGIDAYAQGGLMGASTGKTLSYGKNAHDTRAAFKSMAANTIAYSSGAAASMAYSAEQKLSAGDRG